MTATPFLVLVTFARMGQNRADSGTFCHHNVDARKETVASNAGTHATQFYFWPFLSFGANRWISKRAELNNK
jgi:hypothetical protein